MGKPQIIVSPVDPTWGTASDKDVHLVLVHPEIPANTGNIARLCAGTGTVLHLVEPLGFVLQDRYLRRAGLDYWPGVTMCVHKTWHAIPQVFPADRLRFLTTRAHTPYADAPVAPGVVFVMGCETRGLDQTILDQYPEQQVRIPITGEVRSLNLANASAIVLYDAMNRLGWPLMR